MKASQNKGKCVLLVLVGAALVCLALPALARCAASAAEGFSANRRYKVAPTVEGQVVFYARSGVAEKFEKKGQGKFSTLGHHITTYVTGDGAFFVLHDFYGGLVIGKTDGTAIKTIRAEEILTPQEARKRPNVFDCHPEGRWSDLKSPVTLSPDSKTAQVVLYNGRKIVFRLDTAKAI